MAGLTGNDFTFSVESSKQTPSDQTKIFLIVVGLVVSFIMIINVHETHKQRTYDNAENIFGHCLRGRQNIGQNRSYDRTLRCDLQVVPLVTDGLGAS
jgi:hypothetical protein